MKNRILQILQICALMSLLTFTCFAQNDGATTSTLSDAIRFNFRGAELDEVLDYLSETAGFVIIKEVDVSGTIDAWSHQPLSRAEVIELLNSVLYSKGYAAIASGRMLTIVNRDDAVQRQIPTITGSDPAKIPASDRMVTQILPVLYADVEQLVENLKPLAPEELVMSVNVGSNAIVMTGTQSSIRRMAEIIRALDTSISGITRIQVFQLEYSDASELSEVIRQIYDARAGVTNTTPPRGRPQNQNQTSSIARKVQQLVVAVADQRTNSLIISAPEEVMPDIVKLISQVDKASEEQSILKVFKLNYADAADMATAIESLFAPDDSKQTKQTQIVTSRNRRDNPWTRRWESASGDSDNNLVATPTKAVADSRTNSVIVTASVSNMPQIETMVAKLDSNPAKQKKVFVYSLKNADVANVAEIISQMFEGAKTQNIQRNNVPERQSSGDMTFGMQNNPRN